MVNIERVVATMIPRRNFSMTFSSAAEATDFRARVPLGVFQQKMDKGALC